MTHFCWMTGMIGWMIPKYDLCTIRHAAHIVHYLKSSSVMTCTTIFILTIINTVDKLNEFVNTLHYLQT